MIFYVVVEYHIHLTNCLSDVSHTNIQSILMKKKIIFFLEL